MDVPRVHAALTRLRELLVDLAAQAGVIDRELAGQLRSSAGMRNVLVYEYLDGDLQRIAGAVPTARGAYRRYVQQVAVFLTQAEKSAREVDES